MNLFCRAITLAQTNGIPLYAGPNNWSYSIPPKNATNLLEDKNKNKNISDTHDDDDSISDAKLSNLYNLEKPKGFLSGVTDVSFLIII